MADSLASPPPASSMFEISYPSPFVLLVTINRESAMNSIPMAGHWEGDAIWKWFDDEPSLRVAIITGKGKKSFSAGADLIDAQKLATTNGVPKSMPASGFMGMSRRVGKKPLIAAVNGYAFGGGFEIALNCDMVVASPTAQFALPEAKRGLYAAAGGLPRVVKSFGMQTAAEIALAGRTLSAKEASQYGFARISSSPDALLDDALRLAKEVVNMSPDAIVVSRAALREAWETASVERSAQLIEERYNKALLGGENLRIGLEAFAKKQKPAWKPSKL